MVTSLLSRALLALTLLVIPGVAQNLAIPSGDSLSSNPAFLTVYGAAGGNARTIPLTVGSSAGGRTYTVSTDQPWLTSNPISNATGGVSSVYLTVNPAGLRAGIYTGAATVTAPGFPTATTSVIFHVANPTRSFKAAIVSPFDGLGIDNRQVAADFNGDGKIDIAIVDTASSRISILVGDGSGTFVAGARFAAGGSNPTAIVAADFNGDGKMDLATGSSVLLGNGLGGFAPAADGSFAAGSEGSGAIAAADFNGDGKTDLAVVNQTSGTVGIFLNNGAGALSATRGPISAGTDPRAITVDDFNGDGRQDLAIANAGSDSVSILLGDGSGGFAPGTSLFVSGGPASIAAGDFNNDGKVDLAVTAAQAATILLGDGKGGFLEGSTLTGERFAIGDLDGDGNLDLAYVDGKVTGVYTGNGKGGFAEMAGSPWVLRSTAEALLVSDIDGDGRLDIVVAGSGGMSVLPGSGADSGGIRLVGRIDIPTTTTLTTSASPSPAGEPVTFTATVDGPGNPTGSVRFFVDSISHGSQTLNATGVVTFTTQLLVGVHTIKASFNGSGNYGDSDSSELSFVATELTVKPSALMFYGTAGGTSSVIPFSFTLEPNAAAWAITRSQSWLPGGTDFGSNKGATRNVTANPASLTAGVYQGQVTVSAAGHTPAVVSVTFNVANPAMTLTPAAGSPFAAGPAVRTVIAGDFNGDGKPDMAIVGTGVTILLGDGAGGFAQVSGSPFNAGGTAAALAAADFNGDGKLDLAVGLSSNQAIGVLLGNGAGGFGAANVILTGAAGVPTWIAVADFNGDGDQDIVTANSTSSDVAVLLGNGAGGFTKASASPFALGARPTSVAIGDFNGDGNPDFATANDSPDNITVMLGDGSGRFTVASGSPFAAGDNPTAIAVADLNGDGRQDLVTANRNSNNVTVLLGNGSGGFTAASGSPFAVGQDPRMVVAGDLNGDGKPDLATANIDSGNVSVLWGNGLGGFTAATGSPFAAGSHPLSVAVADFNADGRLDLAAADNGGNGVTVLLGAKGATSTTLTAAPNTSLGGQSVTFTATVTSAYSVKPSGIVTFMDGASTLGAATLNASGVATFSTDVLTSGTHSITAVYAGDVGFLTSTSSGVQQVVSLSSTTTVLASSPNPAAYLQSVTLTATVTSTTATPTGTVMFKEGSTTLGTGILDAFGIATFSTTSLAVATHSITATLLSNPRYTGSTSAAVSQVVTAVSTATALVSSPNPSIHLQSVTFTATVTAAGTPTGTVTFKDGATTLGTGALDASGVATFSTSSLSGATHSITAVYGGETRYLPSTSPVVSQVVRIITINPASVTIYGTAGGAPSTIPVSVASSPAGGNWTVTTDQPWLTTNLASSATGGTVALTLTANPASFAAGVYTSTVTAIAAGYPTAKTLVTFSVANPAFTLNPATGSPFSVGAGIGPYGIAAGDFNGDGKPDLATTNPTSDSVTILLGNGSGGFAATGSPIPVGRYPVSAAVGDFNGDGRADLATANVDSDSVTVLLGNGAGGFTQGTTVLVGIEPRSVTTGDFNGDGKLDLATANSLSNNVSVLLGNGSGGFTEASGSPYHTGSNPYAIAVGDFDGNGKLDLVAANYGSGEMAVLLGNGTGGFTLASASLFRAAVHPQSVAVGDLNSDGKLDVATVNSDSNTVVVVQGDGAGGFSQPRTFPVGNSPFSVAVGDFNGDGKLDLATANNVSRTVTVLLADGSGGFAQAPGSPFAVGHSAISITSGDFNGDGRLDLATPDLDSQSVSVLLGGDARTTTSVTGSPNPSTFGQSATFTATVTASAGIASGTVTFKEGATTLGSGTLNGSGVATFSTSGLTTGTHLITAVYAGGTFFTGSTSPAISQFVKQATITALASSPNPSVFQQSITFTATVTGASGTPTGTVTFKDGSTTLGSPTLNGSGVAIFTTNALTPGSHAITAAYSGDADRDTSISPAVSQLVKQVTATALASSLNPSVLQKLVMFTATVTGTSGIPTGTVTFKDGSTDLGSPTLNGSGVATFTTGSLSAGSHSITAVYSGDTDRAASTSPAVSQLVKQVTATALASSSNPQVFQQSVTFTATVTGTSGTPTSTVTFKDGSTDLGSPTLNGSGVATFTTGSLSAGSHSITAVYSGDADRDTSISPAVSQVVVQVTATALVSSPNPSVSGQSIDFMATVTATSGTPTGLVRFKITASDETITTDRGVGASGVAHLIYPLDEGDYTVKATYLGDTIYATSTSAVIPHLVQQVTTTKLVSSLNPSVSQQSVTFTATVAGGTRTKTGTVTFKDNGTVLGTSTVNAAAAKLSITSLGEGPHSITAEYSGDTHSTSSTSAAVSQFVKQLTATVLSSSQNPSASQQLVTFTTTVTGTSGIPTGSVTFNDGSATLGTAALTAGVATLSTSSLSEGSHSITAVYGGDANSAGSTSGVILQVVNSLIVNPASLAFYGTAGGATSTIPVSITSGSPGANWTATTNQPWLTASPVSGTVLNVTANPASLTAGVRTGKVTLSVPGLPSTTLSVTFSVANPAFALNPAVGSPFRSRAPASPIAAATGDVNGDGKPDLVTTDFVNDVVAVFLGDGAGGFTEAAGSPISTGAGTDPVSIAMGDFNGDGKPDLVTANSVTNNVTLLIGDGSGGFTIAGGSPFSLGSVIDPISITTGDFNGDGKLDLATANEGSHNVTVLLGNGVGGFAAANGSAFLTGGGSSNPNSVAVGDFNGDGIPDLVATGVNGSTILLSDGAGGFTQAGGSPYATAYGLSVAVADFNADGKLDFATTSDSYVKVMLGNGSGGFTLSNSYLFPLAGSLISIAAGDANGDGKPDLVVSDALGEGVMVLLGDGAGGFAQASGSPFATAAGSIPYSVAVGDFNADGKLDVATANYFSGDVTVLLGGSAVTTTTVTAPPSPLTYGQSVTLTATVTPVFSPAPSGTVSFQDATGVLGSGTLDAAGVATFSTSSLSGGTHSITAVYAGNTNYAASTSLPISRVVNKGSSTTELVSSANPAAYQLAVTFTATVKGIAGMPLPSGTVTFKDGTTTLGAGTLDVSGVATFISSALSPGAHSITAQYPGDTNYTASTSLAVSQVVQQVTTTALVSSANPSVEQQSVTFTATISGSSGTPTGTVTFKEGSTTLGTGTLAAGVATFSTSALTAGTHSITAVYSGDATYAASMSAVVSQVVQQVTATALTSSLNPSSPGQSVTFTTTVTASSGTPTGTVTFKDGSTTLGSRTLASGAATLSTSALTAGTHSITAEYSGGTTYATSTSPLVSQVVLQGTTTALSSSLNPSVAQQSVTFTATITASSGTPTGSVTFKDGAAILGTGTLDSSGVAAFSISTLSLGSHPITAVYSGDASYATSTSSTVSQVVRQTTTTALTSSQNSSLPQQSVTFTATITASSGTPTGTVTFKDGAATLGTRTLASGVATLSTSTLSTGTHLITVEYAGDSNNAPSTSPVVSQAVAQGLTTTVLTSSPNSSAYQQLVTFTATVTSPAGIPGGSVLFKDEATSLASVSLNASGIATFTTSSLNLGTHSITAVYANTTSYASSTSDAVSQVVTKAATATVLAGPLNPSTFPQAVNFTATVSAVSGTPAGTVTFRDGGTTVGTAPIVSGVATFTTTALVPGIHSITAYYPGTTTISESLSNTVSQTVDGLAVNPVSLAFYGAAGGASSTIPASVISFGVGGGWTATTNQAWLSANPASDNTLNLTADPSLLTAGVRTGTVTISAGAYPAATVKVTFNVANAAFTLNRAAGSPFAAGPGAQSIAVGDFNGDGKPDIATANSVYQSSSSITVLLGDGDGGYTAASGSPYTPGALMDSIAAADFNRDGKLDLVIANTNSFNIILLLGDGAGGFSQASGSPFSTGGGNPLSVAAGDFNGDGSPDVAASTTGGAIVLLGNGAGGFTLATGSPISFGTSEKIAVGDFNGDGMLDLAATVSSGAAVQLGDGTGRFKPASGSPYAGGTVPIDIAVGDVNGDGKLDLAIANFTSASANVTVLLGNGTGGFTPASGSPFAIVGTPLSIAVGDLDGDGNPDLAVGTNGSSVVVLRGDGAGGFTQANGSPFAVGSYIRAVALADLNGDGRMDIATANSSSANVGILLGAISATSSTALSASPGSSTYAESVTFTATVTPVFTTSPTGTVTFSEGATILGAGTLNAAGKATFSISSMKAGTHPITAVYAGDGNYIASSSPALSYFVSKRSTTTGLTSSQNPSTSLQAVTFTATVTTAAGTPTGVVTFSDQFGIVGSGTLDASGVATFSISSLGSFTHLITAVYAGDTNYNTSTSSTLSQVVVKASTTTELSSSLNPSAYQQAVTFTATVTSSSGTPTGPVTFKDGSTTLGTFGLSAGVAVFSTSSLSIATHSITAEYIGSSDFNGSASLAVSQVVTQGSATAVLTSSVNPSAYQQFVTFTATVTGGSGTPGGTVTFKDGSTSLGTVTLNASGVATLAPISLSVGTHSITAVYGGNTSYPTITSSPVSQVVNPRATNAALTSSLNPSTYLQPVTFTATVSSTAGIPTGTATFMDGSTTLGIGTLNASGVTSFTTSSLGGGTHSITAVYSGSTNHAASTSGIVAQVVNGTASAVSVTSSANPSPYGVGVTLTGKVTATSGTPTGSVTFFDGAVSLGTGILSGGTAILTSAAYGSGNPLVAGTHSIAAVYSGDATYLTATSAATVQSVSKANPQITWPAPLAIAAGTQLSGAQLNATASFGGVSVPGTFLYTPASGTVMNTPGSQPLSAVFTPADTANFGATTGSNAVTVNGVASLTVTRTLARDASGNIVVTLNITNTGGSAAGAVSINSLKIGTFNTSTPVPASIGTIAAGTSASASFVVSGSAGASGGSGQLTFTGTYTGGTITFNGRITLP